MTTNVAGGSGQGGDVLVESVVAIANASRVTADAGGNADAGNILIRTSDGLIESQDNTIRASSQNHDFTRSGWIRFTFLFIGGIQIGRGTGKFRSTGIHPFVNRMHTQTPPMLADGVFIGAK